MFNEKERQKDIIAILHPRATRYSEYNPRENFEKIKGHEHVCRNLYWYEVLR